MAVISLKRCKSSKQPTDNPVGSGLDCGSEDPGSILGIYLTTCGPTDGKDAKDVFGRPCARVWEGSAR